MWFTKGKTTFMEAYQRTGRILNISVVSNEPHSQTKLLNYLTAPDVVIASAVVASSAIPGILPPVQLMQKTDKGDYIPFRGAGKFWRDGSLRKDIPGKGLHLFNVHFTIVSQMNPHIVLFFYRARGSSGSPALHRYILYFNQRSGKGYRGGFIGSSLIQHFLLDLQKWLSLLRDIDLGPKWNETDFSNIWLQRFDGNVTIYPRPLSITDFLWIVSNPSRNRLSRQISRGQVFAWPTIRHIENRMRIEQSIAYWKEVVK
jgi:hypothetical protein